MSSAVGDGGGISPAESQQREDKAPFFYLTHTLSSFRGSGMLPRPLARPLYGVCVRTILLFSQDSAKATAFVVLVGRFGQRRIFSTIAPSYASSTVGSQSPSSLSCLLLVVLLITRGVWHICYICGGCCCCRRRSTAFVEALHRSGAAGVPWRRPLHVSGTPSNRPPLWVE